MTSRKQNLTLPGVLVRVKYIASRGALETVSTEAWRLMPFSRRPWLSRWITLGYDPSSKPKEGGILKNWTISSIFQDCGLSRPACMRRMIRLRLNHAWMSSNILEIFPERSRGTLHTLCGHVYVLNEQYIRRSNASGLVNLCSKSVEHDSCMLVWVHYTSTHPPHPLQADDVVGARDRPPRFACMD